MTPEEYIVERLFNLEFEIKMLKEENERLKKANDVAFRFEGADMTKNIYKVEFENGNIKILRENKNE